MVLSRFLVLMLVLVLASCAGVPVTSDVHYKASEKAHLFKLKRWSFDGRLSLSDGRESWSAAVVWAHTESKDEIKLSGPLGQVAAVITLTDDLVIINRGDEKPRQSRQIDQFIQQQLGVFVPVRALRYWVLGLTQPSSPFFEAGDGFEQSKWNVHYLQMQQIGPEWLPRKIGVEQGEAKLKLVIDQWIL